eukprot:7384108-Prymnesium_polylepis.1
MRSPLRVLLVPVCRAVQVRLAARAQLVARAVRGAHQAAARRELRVELPDALHERGVRRLQRRVVVPEGGSADQSAWPDHAANRASECRVGLRGKEGCANGRRPARCAALRLVAVGI